MFNVCSQAGCLYIKLINNVRKSSSGCYFGLNLTLFLYCLNNIANLIFVANTVYISDVCMMYNFTYFGKYVLNYHPSQYDCS